MSVVEVIDAFKDNQENRILKIHLFDDSLNVHGWGIDRELAASLAEEYAQGAPYLIPPSLNHPVRPYPPFPHYPNDDIADIKRFAAQYKAGECFKTELCASNHANWGYDGYVKLTDPKAIEAFDKGLIPRYSSVSIYNLSDHDRGIINKAQALNICAVRIPAWANAELLGSCKGDESSCHTNLKNAGVQTNNDYCILKTLEQNDFEKYNTKSNTSLKQNSEIVASYDQMSATNQQQQQPITQPVNNNPNVQQTSTSNQPAATSQQPVSNNPVQQPPGITNVPQTQAVKEQVPIEDQAAKSQIEEQLDHKKLYEDLKAQFEQKDALLLDMQKRINKYEKDQESLKIKEIDRFVTVELFNGDQKVHEKKVKEWKDRAENMTLDSLTWHLTEAYGRKLPMDRDREKKAGLNFEPTAVLANGTNQPQRKVSIYDIGSIDLTKGGAY